MGQLGSREPRPISTSRQPVLPRSVTRSPRRESRSSRFRPASAGRRSRGRRFPSAAARRRSRAAGWRGRAGRGDREDRASRSSPQVLGQDRFFCSGGRPWVRRTPARTVATWRSARSNVSPRCAKFHRKRRDPPLEGGDRGRVFRSSRRRRRRRHRARGFAGPGAGRAGHDGAPSRRSGASRIGRLFGCFRRRRLWRSRGGFGEVLQTARQSRSGGGGVRSGVDREVRGRRLGESGVDGYWGHQRPSGVAVTGRLTIALKAGRLRQRILPGSTASLSFGHRSNRPSSAHLASSRAS